MTHYSTPWSQHRGPLVPGTRYIVTDHINDLKQAPAQAPEIYVLCGDSALHLSKQRSFTSCLFSPRAPHSSPISRSPHCLEIGVKIPRLSPLDQQHNYLRCRHQRMSQQSANQRPALADLTNQRLCMAACWHGPHLFLFISISSPSSITEECCSVLCRFIGEHYYIQMIPSLTLWMLDNNTVIMFTE